MKCEDVRESLPDYLAGEAVEARRVDVEAHLAICPACKQDAEMWARLGAWPDEQPRPIVRERFEEMLSAYREGIDHAEKTTRRKFSFSGWLESWWPYRPALQFAIALACLGAGLIGGYQLAGQRTGSEEISQLQHEVRQTRQLIAVSLLRQQSASERLRGVTYSSSVAEPDEEILAALVQTVKYDTNVDVRLAAVDALRRYASLPVVQKGIVEALRAPQSPLVQIALIDLAVEARLRQAADALRNLKGSSETNEVVRERAEWGLQNF